MKVNLKDIVIDEQIYPRASLNEFYVGRLVSALDFGATFPPLTLEAKTKRLVDGRHRYETYQRKGIKQVEAEVKRYASEADLFADAVRLNVGHGQPLTGYDLRSAVARLTEMGYRRDQVSEVVRIRVEQLGKIVKGFAQSPTGHPIALKGGLGHLRGEALTPKQMDAQRHYSGQHAVHYVRQLMLLIEQDLWPKHTPFVDEMDGLALAWIELRDGAAVQPRAAQRRSAAATGATSATTAAPPA